MEIAKKTPKPPKEKVVKAKPDKEKKPKRELTQKSGQHRRSKRADAITILKLPEPRPFDIYKEGLSACEQEKLEAYFSELMLHITLSRAENQAMREDFENALMYYAAADVPLEEAMQRLSYQNLGGFYVRPPILWYDLDDAAKIYPLSMRQSQMAVFRLSAYLKEDVCPELLQIALTFTIKRFPCFATTVKKGFFWHYLDTSKRRYAIKPETEIPCRPLKISRSGSRSFRLLYYNNRISVEYFHILTDGTGGMIFLKTLIAEYLRLKGVTLSECEGILDINAIPRAEETANAFARLTAAEQEKNGDKSRIGSGLVDKPATQMSGRVSKTKPCRLVHFKMDADTLIAAAKARGVTVTAYMLACMFAANRYATDDPVGSINIQVPVNMRKFYPSETVRNFAMYCGIRLPIENITGVDDILDEISHQLVEKTSKETMSEMMDATKRLVDGIKYVPLFIKAPIAGIVYGFLGDKVFSNTLSNLGVVQMPPEMSEHIESMDFVLGTGITNRAGCAMVTVGNVATLAISKRTVDPSFEEKLYELLTLDGVTMRLEGSELYED